MFKKITFRRLTIYEVDIQVTAYVSQCILTSIALDPQELYKMKSLKME